MGVEKKRRHRWGEPDAFEAPDFTRWTCPCGVKRFHQTRHGVWFMVPTGGERFRFADRVPPCNPSNKKTDKGRP